MKTCNVNNLVKKSIFFVAIIFFITTMILTGYKPTFAQAGVTSTDTLTELLTETPVQTETPGHEETEKYSDDDFGFTFKYPVIWQISDRNFVGIGYYTRFLSAENKLELTVSDFNWNQYSNLQSYVDNSLADPTFPISIIDTHATTRGEVKGIETTIVNDGQYIITNYFLRDNYLIIFNYYGRSIDPYPTELNTIFSSLEWGTISYSGEIATEFKPPVISEGEISIAGAPSLTFPFRGTYKISNGYYDDIHFAHANDQWNKYALDFIVNDGGGLATTGKPVYSAHAGTVYYARFNDTGCGFMVKIRYSGDSAYTSYYCHLSSFNISENQVVPQGYVIGYAGSSGVVSGPHIHFALILNGTSSVLPEPMSGYTDFDALEVYTYNDEPPPPSNSITSNPTLYFNNSIVSSPGMCTNYWYPINGAYLTVNTNVGAQSTNYALWSADLPKAGLYKVEAYARYHPVINWSCPTKTFNYDTSDAHYSIFTSNGTVNVSANQSPYNDQWMDLGNYQFLPGVGSKVKLIDLNDEANTTTTISVHNVRFTLVQETCYTLSLSASPTNSGTILASPAPNCNNGTQYSYNTQVNLTAYSEDGYQFNSWSGGVSGVNPAISVIMNGNKSVAGNYTQQCYTLTTTSIPEDGGSVTVSPNTNCSNGAQYLSGTELTIVATANQGYSFDGWSGDLTGENSSTMHSIFGNSSINANFENNVPQVTSVNPASIIAGNSAFTLDVNGNNFLPNSVVLWNGLARPTTFVSSTQLTAAINAADVTAVGTANVVVKNSESVESNALQVAIYTFADVPPSHIFWQYIEGFYAEGITTGCSASPMSYCPDNPVTRAAMAVFLLRAEHGASYIPPVATGVFADLPVTGKEWMQPWMEQFYAEGITTGCSGNPLMYCPENSVTRAAMAVFILRSIHGSDYVPPAATHIFTDLPVAGKEWMEPWVEQFYREGITTGCGIEPLRFCPEDPVKRQAMAVFIDRAFGIEQIP